MTYEYADAGGAAVAFVGDEECEMTCPLVHTGAQLSPSLFPSADFSPLLQNPGFTTRNIVSTGNRYRSIGKQY